MNDHHDMGEQIPPVSPPGRQEDKKVGLPRPPFYASEYLDMAEILQFAMERFGQLILAIMRYTVDETVPEDLPLDLKIMFSVYQKKIDFAREKYQSKCKTNAKNGQKGGLAKAENATKAKFRPPTQKQFRDAVAHFVDAEEIPEGITDYDADSFFDELKEVGWTIGGAPIQFRADWETAIRAKFRQFGSTLPDHFYYTIFSAAFAELHDGEKSDSVAYDLMDAYDEAAKSWNVQGEYFPAPDWKSALARFTKEYSESSNT